MQSTTSHTRFSATRTQNVQKAHLFVAGQGPAPPDLLDALWNCDSVRSVELHPASSLQAWRRLTTGVRVLYAPDPQGAASLELARDSEGTVDETIDQTVDVAPLVVVSNGPELALPAFEWGAVDYLVTPVPARRLAEAIDRAVSLIQTADFSMREILASLQPPRPGRALRKEVIVCRSTRSVRWIPVDEVRWIEGDRNYFKLHSDSGMVRKRGSLSRLEARLPDHFRRVHRSAIVNLRKVVRIDRFANATGQAVLDDGSKVPISRGRRLHAMAPMLAEGR